MATTYIWPVSTENQGHTFSCKLREPAIMPKLKPLAIPSIFDHPVISYKTKEIHVQERQSN
jgi:hypothetical protein